jgi:hypothetical protein
MRTSTAISSEDSCAGYRNWILFEFRTPSWHARDPVILSWAASEERILLTHDRETIPAFVYDRILAGEPMPGVFLVSNLMPKGRAIEERFWAVHCLSPEECKGQIKYYSG